MCYICSADCILVTTILSLRLLYVLVCLCYKLITNLIYPFVWVGLSHLDNLCFSIIYIKKWFSFPFYIMINLIFINIPYTTLVFFCFCFLTITFANLFYRLTTNLIYPYRMERHPSCGLVIEATCLLWLYYTKEMEILT